MQASLSLSKSAMQGLVGVVHEGGNLLNLEGNPWEGIQSPINHWMQEDPRVERQGGRKRRIRKHKGELPPIKT